MFCALRGNGYDGKWQRGPALLARGPSAFINTYEVALTDQLKPVPVTFGGVSWLATCQAVPKIT